MQRLHAPTKATTMGVGAVLVASVLWFAVFRGTITWQELLIVLFLFVTSPITANFLAKVHLHRTVPTGRPAADRHPARLGHLRRRRHRRQNKAPLIARCATIAAT